MLVTILKTIHNYFNYIIKIMLNIILNNCSVLDESCYIIKSRQDKIRFLLQKFIRDQDKIYINFRKISVLLQYFMNIKRIAMPSIIHKHSFRLVNSLAYVQKSWCYLVVYLEFHTHTNTSSKLLIKIF